MKIAKSFLVALLFTGTLGAVNTAMGAGGIPPRVRFTGALVPIKDQSRKGLLEDFNVTIGKKRQTFLLDKMEIVGGVGLNRATLQRLFPPLLRFVGPEDIIARLNSQEIAGRSLVIEGLLYTESGMLFLIGVNDSKEAADATPSAVGRRSDKQSTTRLSLPPTRALRSYGRVLIWVGPRQDLNLTGKIA